MAGDRVITSIQFSPAGVVVTYFDMPGAFRENGLSLTQSLEIPRHADYDDEIDALEVAAAAMLADALEDYAGMEPFDPRQLEPDVDEELGSGNREETAV